MKWNWLKVNKSDGNLTVTGTLPDLGEWKQCERVEEAPRRAGLYGLMLDGELRYVGETANLQKRLTSHYNDTDKNFNSIKWIQVDGGQRIFLEKLFIWVYGPPDNKELTRHDRRMFLKRTLIRGE